MRISRGAFARSDVGIGRVLRCREQCTACPRTDYNYNIFFFYRRSRLEEKKKEYTYDLLLIEVCFLSAICRRRRRRRDSL